MARSTARSTTKKGAHTGAEVELWAHSRNDEGDPHLLEKHLSAVARCAQEFIAIPELKVVAHYAGMWHDMGKGDADFQQKLRTQSNARIEHKGAGVGLAELVESLPLKFVIMGHHGGMPDKQEIPSWYNSLDNQRLTGVIQSMVAEMPALVPTNEVAGQLAHSLACHEDAEIEMLIRMLFSALVDADFLDTEAHFHPEKTPLRGSRASTQELWDLFQKYHHKLGSSDPDKPINRIRSEVYQASLTKAESSQGFYRLTVPTGGGKTLTSLGFALKHLQHHQLQRVIYAIPYTSIIDQVASEFKEIFPDKWVLEHHSNVRWFESEEYPTEKELRARLASENWDMPIIVTTTVQLFESLFANRTSQCRKLHNLIGSVIILDEVQTLPLPLLPVIIDGLRTLVSRFQVTVVFCTATQPALDRFFSDYPDIPVREIAPDPPGLFTSLQRVNYNDKTDEAWSWAKTAQEIRRHDRVMAVVNTKKDAVQLWGELNNSNVWHLSSAMCPAHRKTVLETIRHRLDDRGTCRLVSTQVVEAGVDIDFDTVYRALGPLDRIVQAGGRCNREGQLEKGEVTIFRPEEGGQPPGVYQVSTAKTVQLLADVNLNDPTTFPLYFDRVYDDITMDRDDIKAKREKLRFKEVAKLFQMIPDDTVTVIVKYAPEAEEIEGLVKRLRSRTGNPRILLRKLQPYMVSVSHYAYQKHAWLAEEIMPGVYYWGGKYHEHLGLGFDADLLRTIY